jgi:hypothetical protein
MEKEAMIKDLKAEMDYMTRQANLARSKEDR